MSLIHSPGIYPDQPVAQFELGTQRNFVYLVLDWSGVPGRRQAAIIDPQRDIETPLQALKHHGFILSAVLLTHSHSDHTAGLPYLLERFPELPVYAHLSEQKRLKKYTRNRSAFHALEDGTLIPVGKEELRTLHTPGHSAGECCFLLHARPNYLFTGDMLFIGDCGRTDLDTGNTNEMFQSLQKLRSLAGEIEDAVVLPGHHYSEGCASTLQSELQNSPPFQCQSSHCLERLP
ncbi:MAG: hypothetical protein A2X94_12720 [Bdellovibrionales bacterium GWB1_55_8]|nr:MAG: hypothetical protein A2X94_12720 [Bdellovibrionales bacterium GWB1_55_8]